MDWRNGPFGNSRRGALPGMNNRPLWEITGNPALPWITVVVNSLETFSNA
jgi:hypothetical protein